MTREVQIAWAAGFIDGDGCVRFRRRNRNGAPLVRPCLEAVQAVTAEPLEVLHELFGGCVQEKGRRTGGGKTVYVWRITDRPALAALAELLPHLVVKREAARDMIAYFERERVYECKHGARPGHCSDCKREYWAKIPLEIRRQKARGMARARWAK